jgi:ElaB/YqjD/DUF883 family membrane-anchored ribosome-binding protein
MKLAPAYCAGREKRWLSSNEHKAYVSEFKMNKQMQSLGDDMGMVADYARALIAATADVAEQKVSEARKRLADALEGGTGIYSRVREQAAQGVRAADEVVQKHPYEAIAVSACVGAVVGFLLARECSRNRN